MADEFVRDDPVLLDYTQEGLAFLTLNRPDKRNAFDGDMVKALADAFETLRAGDQLRAVFIEGAGETFCAGADLEWMRASRDWTHSDNVQDAMELARMLKALRTLPILTVAQVEGAALGGGAGIVAACDVVTATEDTIFGFTETRLGLLPATIAPHVIEAIGPRHARALFMTGRRFGAAEAKAMRLVHHVVPDKTAQAELSEHLADDIMSAAPGAVAAAKDLVERCYGRVIDDHLMRETAEAIADRRTSPEGQEGLEAFFEKRKPNWARQP